MLDKIIGHGRNYSVTVAFDVDGTLISARDNTPRYEVIELFHLLYKMSCNMVIWSGGGVEYAERWAEKLGLLANIVPKGSINPDIAVDDMDASLGKINLRV